MIQKNKLFIIIFVTCVFFIIAYVFFTKETSAPIPYEFLKDTLVRIQEPRPNQIIKSPMIIKGEARGYWFFEGSFPVVLTDWDGKIIAEHYATAHPPVGGDWMTEDFVPFESKLIFEKPMYGKQGTLILKKDNPSGLPENDDALEIPVSFE